MAKVTQLQRGLSSGVGVWWRGTILISNRGGALVSSRAVVGSVSSLGGVGVDRGALVGDVSDETSLVVGVVSDGLDSAIGKRYLVRSLDNTIITLGLALLESSSCVFVLYTIFIGIRLRGQLLLSVGGRLIGRARFVSRGGSVRGRCVVWRWRTVRTGSGGNHTGSEGNKLKAP